MSPETRRRLLSVDRAVGRYSRSLQQRTNPCRADGNPQEQADNFRRALERSELRAQQVREVLCAMGVPPMQSVAYRNFGLRLDKLIRENSGATLRLRATEALDYWTAYGLRPEVLSAICETVFGLDMETQAAGHNPIASSQLGLCPKAGKVGFCLKPGQGSDRRSGLPVPSAP